MQKLFKLSFCFVILDLSLISISTLFTQICALFCQVLKLLDACLMTIWQAVKDDRE